MELLAALDKSFQHTHGVLTGLSPAQYADPTPCEKWTVEELLEHMIGVVAGLGAAASGTPGGEFKLGDDPAAQFRSAADVTLAAWSAPGVLEKIIDAGPGPMPGSVLAGINLLDTTTHAWDLSVAVGRPSALPDDVAAEALAQARAIISPEIRPGRFEPEVTAPADATVTELLAAYLGRNPR
jgi:uncharacterized protein (TIGR03086 family)